MNTAIIIQARVGSHRLPRKTLMPLGQNGLTVLDQVIHRASFFIPKDQIIVATTDNYKDKEIIDLCKEKSYHYFTGSENDVLDRYYKTAKAFKLEHIIRICADSPLIDPDLLKLMHKKYKEEKYDYLSNTLEDTFPEGLNAEFFSFKSLETAWEKAKLPSEREHVTPYIKNHKEFYKYSYCRNPKDSHKRWTLDYLEDYQFISEIYKELSRKRPYFTTSDIDQLLEKKPELTIINNNIPRNEGYLKSLEKDLLYEQ